MECFETTSATGQGFWGKNYEFKLVRRQRHYDSRFGQHRRDLFDYGLYFRESSASRWDKRMFVSEEERATFLARSISDLRLTLLPEALPTKSDHLFSSLIGEHLSSVTFVMDYLQIHFTHHRFNFYNWPVLYEGQVSLTHQDEGYSNKLIGLIGKMISVADEYLDIGLGLEFVDGPLLSIPLRVEEDFLTSEIAEYRGPNDHGMIWSVGEAPFE